MKGVDLSVVQGERVAIIGGSGCGKSVFLRSLALLEKPDAGQILIDGRDITAAKGSQVDEIRRSMGMMFQKFQLFSEMDVMDNLCLAPIRILKMPRAEAEKSFPRGIGRLDADRHRLWRHGLQSLRAGKRRPAGDHSEEYFETAGIQLQRRQESDQYSDESVTLWNTPLKNNQT